MKHIAIRHRASLNELPREERELLIHLQRWCHGYAGSRSRRSLTQSLLQSSKSSLSKISFRKEGCRVPRKWIGFYPMCLVAGLVLGYIAGIIYNIWGLV